jgi:hypothetical protein
MPAAAPPPVICAPGAFAAYDDISGIWSPCVAPRGLVVVESTYIQNASAVGGTNYAAYPMLDLRTGVLPGLEFAFHSPAQVAESGPKGIGLYPRTHPGYGLRFAALTAPRLSVIVATDVLPPMSRFSPNQVQSQYVFGATSAYEITPRFAMGFAASGTSSGKAGFARFLPAQAFKASYAIGRGTAISVDLGSSEPARRTPQRFGDLALNQAVNSHVAFKLGVGTAFNAAMNSKAHYLATGFNYRI